MSNKIYEDKFVDGDRMVTVLIRREEEPRPRKFARAYVSNWSDDLKTAEVLGGFAKALGLDSHYTERGKYPAMDKAWDAFNSIIIDSKTADLKLVLPRIAEQVPGLKNVELKFDRKAGCTCGCSPGFILKGAPSDHNIWVGLSRGELV